MENNFKNDVPEKRTVYRPKKASTNNFNVNLDFLNKRLLWNSLNAFISGLLGGIIFAIGALAFLSVNNKNIGSAVSSIGLMVIFAYGFGFYTSKICYSIKNKTEQNLMLFPIWLGNLLGALSVGFLMTLVRKNISDLLYKRAEQICDQKLGDSIGGILILSVFCGLLMFIITDNYKNAKNAAQKYVTLVFATMAFWLIGFEHFVSGAFLFAVSGGFDIKGFWYLLIMTFGNTIGALIIPLTHCGVKFIQNKAKE